MSDMYREVGSWWITAAVAGKRESSLGVWRGKEGWIEEYWGCWDGWDTSILSSIVCRRVRRKWGE
jgi:hypothetical protein